MGRQRYDAERKTDRETKAELWARYRAAGGCGDCGIPIDRFARCLKHRRKRAKLNLKYYHRSKEVEARAA